jgi:hypothetical protein
MSQPLPSRPDLFAMGATSHRLLGTAECVAENLASLTPLAVTLICACRIVGFAASSLMIRHPSFKILPSGRISNEQHYSFSPSRSNAKKKIA